MSKCINISMNEKDLERIDRYCNLHEITRSKFFVQSAIEKVNVADMTDGILLMNKILINQGKDALTHEEKEIFEKVQELINADWSSMNG